MPDPDDIEDVDPADETANTNRSIEQGGGVGARELASQRDPGKDYLPEIVADEEAEADVEKP